ncbi:hypothetical protein EJ06DRAFT_525059 [Trichodelitschia bisporula]|uniref:Uncharacterized protein n=1 Tax=Trichodelitschia bisporula TaxID=703511 RepID=A0A6G1HJ22_9PEZI|nr:hypothetical protein EJ06DRAFT_525059 [Trichodelitschia bisporula]
MPSSIDADARELPLPESAIGASSLATHQSVTSLAPLPPSPEFLTLIDEARKSARNLRMLVRSTAAEQLASDAKVRDVVQQCRKARRDFFANIDGVLGEREQRDARTMRAAWEAWTDVYVALEEYERMVGWAATREHGDESDTPELEELGDMEEEELRKTYNPFHRRGVDPLGPEERKRPATTVPERREEGRYSQVRGPGARSGKRRQPEADQEALRGSKHYCNIIDHLKFSLLAQGIVTRHDRYPAISAKASQRTPANSRLVFSNPTRHNCSASLALYEYEMALKILSSNARRTAGAK